MAGGRNGARDHALPFGIALDGGAQSLDHAHRLMADDQAAADRIFAFQDVHVGAADRRRGHAQQRIQRPHFGNWLLIQHDPAGFDEHRRFHLGHRDSLLEGTSSWLHCRPLPAPCGRTDLSGVPAEGFPLLFSPGGRKLAVARSAYPYRRHESLLRKRDQPHLYAFSEQEWYRSARTRSDTPHPSSELAGLNEERLACPLSSGLSRRMVCSPRTPGAQ
jgi:hypothetical protein